MTPSRRPLGALLVTCLTTLAMTFALVAAATPSADAVRKHGNQRFKAWAALSSADITPGTQMYTDGAQCSANFVYTDGAGNVYVGYAAHCASLGGSSDTDGCDTPSLPVGTPVTFNSGGSLVSSGDVLGRGTLAYSSWLAMQALGTADEETCAYNDLALVRVDAADVAKVNPTVPMWGGPTGLASSGTAAGDLVYSYGGSSLRAGISLLSPKVGTSLGDSAGGWSHTVFTVTPGIPGDSGSGFLNADGQALGTLSTLTLTPLAGSNGVGDLAKELAFAQQHSGISGLKLTKGTEFSGIG